MSGAPDGVTYVPGLYTRWRERGLDAPPPVRMTVGRGGGCKTEFLFKIMEVDHVVPRSRGGSDHPENLQLLCPNCNRIKGDRDMAYLVARLGEG